MLIMINPKTTKKELKEIGEEFNGKIIDDTDRKEILESNEFLENVKYTRFNDGSEKIYFKYYSKVYHISIESVGYNKNKVNLFTSKPIPEIW